MNIKTQNKNKLINICGTSFANQIDFNYIYNTIDKLSDIESIDQQNELNHILKLLSHLEFHIIKLNSELGIYSRQIYNVREYTEKFIELFEEEYKKEMWSKMSYKIDDLINFLRKNKTKFNLENKEENYWEKFKRISKDGLSFVGENFKTLFSYIPVLGIKNEFKERFEKAFSEKVFEELHIEVTKTIIPRITNKLKKIQDLDPNNFNISTVKSMNYDVSDIDIIFPMTLISNVAPALVGGAGMFALAAGWHTLAWSFANLFIPLFGALSIFTLGLLPFIKNWDIDSKIKKYEDIKYRMQNILNGPASAMVLLEVKKYMDSETKNISNKFFSEVFKYDVDRKQINITVNELILIKKQLEQRIFEVYKETGNFRFDNTNKIDVYSQKGEYISALLHLSLYFEEMIRTLKNKYEIDLSNELEVGTFYIINNLRDRNIISEKTADNCHYLRVKRNWVIHNFRSLHDLSDEYLKQQFDDMYKKYKSILKIGIL